MPHFEFGPSLLEHLLLRSGFTQNTKLRDFPREAAGKLSEALSAASDFVKAEPKSGVIVQKVEVRPSAESGQQEFRTHVEFHPYLFQQFQDKAVLRFTMIKLGKIVSK